jgi:WD40 repeat protein
MLALWHRRTRVFPRSGGFALAALGLLVGGVSPGCAGPPAAEEPARCPASPTAPEAPPAPEMPAIHRTLSGHTGRVLDTEFSPDGKAIATASADGTAKVWDAETGALRLTLRGHDAPIGDVDFSPDGTELATVGRDGTAKLWDAETGALRRALRGPGGPLCAVAYNPRGDTLLTAGDRVEVWARETGRRRFALARRGAEFSPDGARLLTTRGDAAEVRDAETGALLLTLRGHTGAVTDADYRPDGREIATAGADGTARLWDAEAGALRRVLSHAWGLSGVVYHPKGAELVTLTRSGAGVWSAAGERPALFLSPLLAHSPDGAARVFSTPAAYLLWPEWLLVKSGEGGERRASVRGVVREAEFSPDGAWLVTAGEGDSATVWRMR